MTKTPESPATDEPPRVGAAVARPKKKISADGVYDISLDLYHSNCCVGPSVSSSGLRTIESQSLLHYWDDSDLNPEREPFVQSKAMILGSAAHWLMLGQHGFAEHFVLRPDEAPDAKGAMGPWHGVKAFCKRWEADAALSGKTPIASDMLTTVRGMASQLSKHPLIKAGLFNGEAEKSLIWKDPETGIWLKSRPDVLPAAGAVRADLKTTKDASARACQRTLDDYGLHMQAALVCEAQEAIFGWPRRDTECVLVFVETTRPYAVSVRPIDENAIYYARGLNRRALRKLADALEKDDFPGYDSDMETVSLGEWRMKDLKQQARLGMLPGCRAE